MSDLDADVEGGERGRHRTRWQPDFPECASKAEAVNKAKCKRNAPTIIDIAGEKVFQRDIHDRRRDCGLHNNGRNNNEIERGKRECDRMRERKCGDDLDHRHQSSCPQNDGDQKRNVVITQEDVLDPGNQISLQR